VDHTINKRLPNTQIGHRRPSLPPAERSTAATSVGTDLMSWSAQEWPLASMSLVNPTAGKNEPNAFYSRQGGTFF
jgi:hypothetical protein